MGLQRGRFIHGALFLEPVLSVWVAAQFVSEEEIGFLDSIYSEALILLVFQLPPSGGKQGGKLGESRSGIHNHVTVPDLTESTRIFKAYYKKVEKKIYSYKYYLETYCNGL